MTMLYTYEYDTQYTPAMPVIDVSIGRARSIPEYTFSALADSGSDATMFPLRYLRHVGVRRGKQITIRGLTGGSRMSFFHLISLKIGGQVISEFEVVGSADLNEAIVGRDLLNQFIVTMNGLASTVEIAQ